MSTSQARILPRAPAREAAQLVPPTAAVIEAVIEAAGEQECVPLTGAYRLDLIAWHTDSLGIPFTPLWPPELRMRCAELSKRLAEAVAGPPAEAGRETGSTVSRPAP